MSAIVLLGLALASPPSVVVALESSTDRGLTMMRALLSDGTLIES